MSVLSFMLARLLAVWFRRLMLAPKLARIAPTSSSAPSSAVIAAPALAAVSRVRAATSVLSVVSRVPRSVLTSKLRVSAELEPIWKLTAAASLVVNRFSPAYLVLLKMLVISLANSSNSDCREVRSSAELVSFAAWVARSFIRCRMSVVSLNAPSAVCSREMASPVLRMATSMPRDWALRRVAICRPAASSAALLMRRPVPRRCWLVPRALLVLPRLVWVTSEE